MVLDGLFSRPLCLHPAKYLLALKRLERRDDDYCEGFVSLREVHLIMVDNPTDVLSVCKHFIEHFCIYIHEGNCPALFLLDLSVALVSG